MSSKLKTVDEAPEAPVEGLTFKQKLFRLQNSIRGIAKDKENPHFRYKYISAQNVNEVVKETLESLHLIVQQNTEYVATLGNVLIAKTVLTLLDVDSDAFITFESIGSGTDTSDKHAMKAATASSKYATMAMIFGASKDDPEAVVNPGDVAAKATTAPAVARTNRPAAKAAAPVPVANATAAGAKASMQGPVEMENGVKVVTVGVDQVYAGRPSKTSPDKSGPGTVLGANGERYDTFDLGLLGIAKKAKADGKLVNIMYTVDAQWNRNKIIDDGLGIFGEVEADEPAAGTESDEY